MAATATPNTSTTQLPPPSIASKSAGTLTLLPPELRLGIYTCYLNTTLACLASYLTAATSASSKHQSLCLPLLSTCRLIRNEAYPLYFPTLERVLDLVRKERRHLIRTIYEGECLGKEAGGVEVLGVWLGLDVRVKELEEIEMRIERWLERGVSVA